MVLIDLVHERDLFFFIFLVFLDLLVLLVLFFVFDADLFHLDLILLGPLSHPRVLGVELHQGVLEDPHQDLYRQEALHVILQVLQQLVYVDNLVLHFEVLDHIGQGKRCLVHQSLVHFQVVSAQSDVPEVVHCDPPQLYGVGPLGHLMHKLNLLLCGGLFGGEFLDDELDFGALHLACDVHQLLVHLQHNGFLPALRGGPHQLQILIAHLLEGHEELEEVF
mmetsp:Transcript_23114/g.22531  ORF Transcript_23114/g.22531 Transcript_23114/m.22531 type:complete len:221 (+) Transcript_23114:900-1562(+)